jgi:hypothetical protein
LDKFDLFFVFGYDLKDVILSSFSGSNFIPYVNLSFVLKHDNDFSIVISDVSDVCQSQLGLLVLASAKNYENLVLISYDMTTTQWSIVSTFKNGMVIRSDTKITYYFASFWD